MFYRTSFDLLLSLFCRSLTRVCRTVFSEMSFLFSSWMSASCWFWVLAALAVREETWSMKLIGKRKGKRSNFHPKPRPFPGTLRRSLEALVENMLFWIVTRLWWTNLRAQGFNLGVFFNLEILVLLLEGFNNCLKIIIFPPRGENLLLWPCQCLVISLGLRIWWWVTEMSWVSCHHDRNGRTGWQGH